MTTAAQQSHTRGARRLVVSIIVVTAAVATIVWVLASGMVARDASTGVASALARSASTPAPELPTRGLSGEEVEVPVFGSPLAPTVTIVNFWASWCGPCRDEAPAFAALASDYDSDDVVVVGMNAQDLAADATAFVDEFDITYPVVKASRDDEQAWGVRGFPETFVVNERGRVVRMFNGPVDAETLRAVVAEELAA